MKRERRHPTREDWLNIASGRSGRRGIKVTPEQLRRLRQNQARGSSQREGRIRGGHRR